jgi:hypothetical protein
MDSISQFNSSFIFTDNPQDIIEVKLIIKFLKFNFNVESFQDWLINNDINTNPTIVANQRKKLFLHGYILSDNTDSFSESKSFGTAKSPPRFNTKPFNNLPTNFENDEEDNISSKLDKLLTISEHNNQLLINQNNNVQNLDTLLNNPNIFAAELCKKYIGYSFDIRCKKIDERYFKRRYISDGVITEVLKKSKKSKK